MLIAGACANLEKDFKKVVAMSTLSQLGIMLFVLSIGLWALSFLHMVIHAFFKRMLFLRTGSLIRHYGGGQDSRFYRSNSFSVRAALFFLVSCVSLSGFPFFIGFYSKDIIILSSSLGSGYLVYLLFLGGCIFTVFYSFRLFSVGYSSWFKGYRTLVFSES